MARVKRSNDDIMQRRRDVLSLLDEGHSVSAVALRVGCSRSSVLRWLAASLDGGTTPAPVTPHSGRPSWLTDEGKEKLRTRLSASPRRRGIDADWWTPALAHAQLNGVSRAEFTPATAAKVIRGLGFRLVRRATDATGAVVEAHWEPVGADG